MAKAFPHPPSPPHGTTAFLPNSQVIRAGAGGTLDIDADGNPVVTRPAQGWTNADGSTAYVSTQFQTGVGRTDCAGQTVLGLKDAHAQLDVKNARVMPNASADGNLFGQLGAPRNSEISLHANAIG